MQLPHRLIRRIEQSPTIDRIADPLARLAAPLASRPRITSALTGRWLGHSVHPMIVAVPLGSWLGATILDATTPGTGAARRLVGAGVIGAAPAALTGTADWLDTSGAERRVGVVHALANDAAVGLFALSWLARRRGSNTTGIVLGVFGLGAVGVAGYLGGHLAYVRGVGVNTTAFQSGPDSWQRIADLEDLSTGRPTQIDIDGLALVAVRRDDDVAVLEDRCTHRGGPLSEGEVSGACIRCPWHDSHFSLDDGSVERGPASIPQPSYRVRVVDSSVEIERDEPGGLRVNPVGARHGTAN
jgi:nitrite reductase/ring-hydroxylating ferredoxin subunit/uncharacterized membrane protein